jgi:hypothetical protein
VADRIANHGGRRALIAAFLFSIYDLRMACISKLYASIANYVAVANAGILIGISSAGNRLTGATPPRQEEQRHAQL